MAKMREQRKRARALEKKLAKEHYAKVVALGCSVADLGSECFGDVVPHHKTGGGMGMKSDYKKTMGLCLGHHTAGGFGECVHNGTKSFEKKYRTQDEMIKITLALIS